MIANPMLARARTGALLLGITPPRRNATPERVAEIARATLARLESLDLDGLVLYDIDDESDRNPDERPFPYLPTVDPAVFHTEYLGRCQRPVVIYRCVGKYAEDEIGAWLRAADPGAMSGVFVGASSRDKPVRTSLARAHTLRQEIRPDLPVGGVAITERYTSGGDEHLRMLAKQERGCAHPGGVGPDPERVLSPLARNVAFLDRLPAGVQAIPTPGHTPGHTSLLTTDPHTEERVLILGDLLHTRAQFAEPTWHFRSDSDPVLAERQRIDVLSRYRDAQTVIAGGHFAGNVFGAEPPGPAARPC